jgi:hypothetical protein
MSVVFAEAELIFIRRWKESASCSGSAGCLGSRIFMEQCWRTKRMRIALYWILFLGQTIGDAAILSLLIPLFRRLVTSGHYEKIPPEIFVFAALGVIIIQVCYWLGQHWFVTLRLGHNSLPGHLILFLSRLNFIFAGAVFSAVCLVRFNELDISVWGFVFLFTVLFSIFCYTLELERLGRALVERKDHS